MYKIIQFNSIQNIDGKIKYNYNIIKIIPTFAQAVEVAMKLKLKTGKLYKIEKV